MKKLAIIATTILLITACSNSSKTILGIYQGTLPCADCEKIEAKLVLNADQTYQYQTVSFKNKEKLTLVEEGKFHWDPNKDKVIRLKNNITATLPDILFKVSKNAVEMCDTNGNTVKGLHNYQLYKVAP